MYFASRVQAGRMLASQLTPKYRYENCAVVALNDGGVMVGAQIAMALHCVLSLLLTEEIILPRENDAIAGITQDGSFSYNGKFADAEINEMVSEYYQVIEQSKLEHMHHMLSSSATIDRALLKGRNIILVSDGFKNGFALDLAVQYLKSIAIEKLIVATPLASVQAVDRMHVTADDLYVLSVVSDYFSTEHYYDTQDIPDHDTIIEIIERVILNWQ
jgi:putative phosphoribosyl transferase